MWLRVLRECAASAEKIIMRSVSTDEPDRQLTVAPSTEPRRSRTVVFFAFIVAMLGTNPGMKTVTRLSSVILQTCSRCAIKDQSIWVRSNGVFTRCDRRGDPSRDRSPIAATIASCKHRIRRLVGRCERANNSSSFSRLHS